MQETHQGEGRETTEIVNEASARGWKTVVSPARETARADRAGGVLIAAKKHASVHSYRHLAMYDGQSYGLRCLNSKIFRPGPIDFNGFVALSVRCCGITITAISLYMEPSIGLTGPNLSRLAMLGAFVDSLAGPWAIVGDWNATPQELVATSWVKTARGTIVVPSNTSYTCTAGEGRLIDFAVISMSAVPLLHHCEVVDDGRWKSHYGLRLEWRLQVDAMLARVWILPKPFTQPPKPKKGADPLSKSSLKKAEALTKTVPKPASKAVVGIPGVARVKLPAKGPPPLGYLRREMVVPRSDLDDEDWFFNEQPPEEDIPFLEPPDESEFLDQEPMVNPCGAEEEMVPPGDVLNDLLTTPPCTDAPVRPIDWANELQKQSWWQVLGLAHTEEDCEKVRIKSTRHSVDSQTVDIDDDKLVRNNPPCHVVGSMAFAYHPEGALALGAMFGDWITKFEDFMCRMHAVNWEESQKFRGRARAPRIVFRPMPTGAETVRHSDPGVNWWCCTAAWLEEMVRCLKARGKVRWTRLVRKCKSVSASIPNTAHLPLQKPTRAKWTDAMGKVDILDDNTLTEMAASARSNADRAARSVANRAVKAYTKWIGEAFSVNPGAVHRRMRDPQDMVDEIRTAEGSTKNMVQFMDAKADIWRSKWDVPLDRAGSNFHAFTYAMQRVAAAARYEGIERWSVADVRAVCMKMAKKAFSVDQLGARDILVLPDNAIRELLDLFFEIVRCGTIPWQWMTVIIALLPKNASSDRAIGLCFSLLRILTALYAGDTRCWLGERSEVWDTAVRGSSALRAAMLRAFRDEAVAEHQLKSLTTASICWDIEAFYDSLDIVKVVEQSLVQKYPPCVLLVEALTCAAPRVLRERGCFSAAIIPLQSVVAGTRSGGNFARCFLQKPMRELIAASNSIVSTRAWVDDVVQRAEHTRRVVVDSLVHSGSAFVRGIAALGLRVASKSAVIALDPDIGREIVGRLNAIGIHVAYADTVADLGVDRGCIVGNGRPRRKVRFDAAVRRYGRCQRLAKLSPLARSVAQKLARTGAAPQDEWTDPVHGAAPTVVAWRRRTWGALLSRQRFGRCLTTLLQLELAERDPAIEVIQSLLASWIYLVEQEEQHAVISQFWPRAVSRISALAPNVRWRHVRACGTALITALLDLGWQLHGPVDWTDDTGVRFQAELGNLLKGPNDWSSLKVAVSDAVKRQMWKRASDFHNGSGLSDVPETSEPRRHLRRLRKFGKFERVGAMRAVMCGASWPRVRLRDAGIHVPSVICPRCGLEEETEWHRAWECSANSKLSKVHSGIVATAVKHGRDNPSFWLRGLLPKHHTDDGAPHYCSPTCWGQVPSSADSWQGCIIAAGDGSGGPHSADTRYRRCGYSAVVFNLSGGVDATSIAGAGCEILRYLELGRVPGRQSINRAEVCSLQAALEATQSASDSILLFVTDSDYVIRGVSCIKRNFMPETHRDLWHVVRSFMVGRRLALFKVESHMTAARAAEVDVPYFALVANLLADKLAGEAASQAQIDEDTMAGYKMADDLAAGVRSYLASSFLDAVTVDPESRPPSRRPRPRPLTIHERIAGSEHDAAINDDGQVHCTRCGSCVGRKSAKKWLLSKCVPQAAHHGDLTRLFPDCEVVIGHSTIHESHCILRSRALELVFCSRCGSMGRCHLRHLAKPCRQVLNQAGAQNLSRLSKGLMPGTSKRANTFNQRKE